MVEAAGGPCSDVVGEIAEKAEVGGAPVGAMGNCGMAGGGFVPPKGKRGNAPGGRFVGAPTNPGGSGKLVGAPTNPGGSGKLVGAPTNPGGSAMLVIAGNAMPGGNTRLVGAPPDGNGHTGVAGGGCETSGAGKSGTDAG